MNQEQIKHVCLETLSYDQIEEIEKGKFIKLLVHTPFSQYCFQSKRQMHEIINYLNYMKKYGIILNSITDKELSIIDQDYVQDQKNAIIILNKIFDEVLIRRDFLSRSCTLELLGLKYDDVKVAFKNQYLIPDQVKGFLLNDYSMVVSSINLNGDLIAITLANNSKLQKFGKIWNLIEPELMGQIIIYSLSQILEEEKNPIKIYDKQYGFKLFDIDYEKNRNEYLVANCQGQIITYQKLEYENTIVIQEGQIIQVIPTSIYHLKIHNSEIYIITDNQIKILNDKYQIIGGGSLKSRLNGGFIQIMKFDKLLILLGTDKGDLLIYQRTNNIEFITLIQVKGSIRNITFSQKYIFLVANNTLAIQKETWNQTAEFNCGHKMIDFLLIKDNYFGITQDGLFVEWHKESGQIVQTLKFSHNNIYSIYRDQLVIVISDDCFINFIKLQSR